MKKRWERTRRQERWRRQERRKVTTKTKKERKIHRTACDSDHLVLNHSHLLSVKGLEQNRAHQHHSKGINWESILHAFFSCSSLLLSGHPFRLITVSTSSLFLLHSVHRHPIFLTCSSAGAHLDCSYFHEIENRAVRFLILCFYFWGHYFCGLKGMMPAEFVNMQFSWHRSQKFTSCSLKLTQCDGIWVHNM